MKRVEWVWQGVPGHFICAFECRFRLSTQVGKYLVSTVGELVREGQNEFQEIGLNRKYETMVFGDLVKCECGCEYYIPGNFSEIDFAPYNTSVDAQKGHMKMCKKYERLQQK